MTMLSNYDTHDITQIARVVELNGHFRRMSEQLICWKIQQKENFTVS